MAAGLRSERLGPDAADPMIAVNTWLASSFHRNSAHAKQSRPALVQTIFCIAKRKRGTLGGGK